MVKPHRGTLILLSQALGCEPEDIDPYHDRSPAGNGASVIADDADGARDDVRKA